jgi:PiT family inorganic phosphate transporter
MVRYRTAVLVTSLFVVLGAGLEGSAGVKTLSSLTSQSMLSAFVSILSAGLTLTIMTLLKLPVSSSQATVGGIIGIGIFRRHINFQGMNKVLICWIGTPLGSMVAAVVLYLVLRNIINRLKLNLIQMDFLMRTGLVLGGAYGAYALGANNVASVTGVFAGVIDLSPLALVLIGAGSISLGVITFSRNVMYTIGRKLVPLGAYSALVAILAEAVTVHIYAMIGVPVSTSQAIIGAVLGIGLINGMHTINRRTLFHILAGWVSTPLMAGIISYGIIHVVS